MKKNQTGRKAAGALAVIAAGFALVRIGMKALAHAENRGPEPRPPSPTPERPFERVPID